MTINEARTANYSMYQKFADAANNVRIQREEALKNSKLYPHDKEIFENEAATLELKYNAYNKKSEEYLDFCNKIAEMECAYANMKNEQYRSEDAGKEAAEQAKIMMIAARITRGDIVPPEDEEKLMKYDYKLYMAAKSASVLAKEHKKDDSLWDDEEEMTEERENPMEYAGNCEAPAGGPDLNVEVSDAAVDIETE